jgi:hypothetical protein
MTTQRATHLAESWNMNWFGFWGDEDQVTGVPFSIEDHVDASWHPDDLERLIRYLATSPIAAVTQGTEGKCGLCDATVTDSCYRSDGVWIWPDTLAHLVEKHAFVLPARLVEHIRSRGYKPPVELSGNIGDLPWPK